MLGHQHDLEAALLGSALMHPFHAGAVGVQASGRVGHLANRVTNISAFNVKGGDDYFRETV